MAHRQHYGHRTGLAGIPLLTAILLAAAMPMAAAQDFGDVTAGRKLAQTWCSSCHEVEPAPRQGNDNGAPAFTAIALIPSTTPMALRAFLQTPHAQMPDLHLSRDEIDDLAGYILSLRPH
jgi:mono/diheme cytochrome c family protein